MKSSIPQSRQVRHSAAARLLFFIIILMVVALVFAAGAGAAMRSFFDGGDISVTKTGPDTAPADTDITYTITVTSSGPDDVTSASLIDNLPAGTTFVSLTKPASWSCTDPSVGTNGQVNCSNSLVPPGANDVFTLVAHINPGVSPGTFITNQAVVDGFPNNNTENDSSPATTQVSGNFADLGLSKSSPDQAVANSDVPFTITVSNFGPGTATNVNFSDTLPGGSPGGHPMTFGSFVQNSGPAWNCPSPAATTTCHIDNLAANSTSIFTFVGHIPSGAAGTQYTNNATVTSDVDPNPDNDTGSATTTAVTCFTAPVVTTNADSGAGSLRQAIIDACDGATISFDMTQVVSPISLSGGQITINKNLTIQGPGANVLTTSGNNSSRVFNVTVASPGVVTFSGLTISNGKASGSFNSGGAIRNFSTGTVNVLNSTLSGNTADFTGGGIYNQSTGTVNVTNSTLSNNSATSIFGGGGIANQTTGTVSVTNSTLNSNSSVGGGAGIFNNGDGTVNVINSTLSGNSASGSGKGGAIYNNTGTVNVTNSTLSGNSAPSFGGGLSNNGGLVQIRNSIIALNTASSQPDLNNTMTSQGHNLIGKKDGSTGFTNGTNGDIVGTIAAPINPLLGLLANNGGPTQTMALLAGSPALDAGDNCVFDNSCTPALAAAITTDQRDTGFARKVDGPDADTTATVDIGAFEAQVSVEDITDKTTNEDTQLQFTFNVGGAASISSVTATSSNTALVPNNVANIAVSGSGSTRTLTINPLADKFGTSTITVTVNGTNSQSMTDTFVLTVAPVAETPSVTNAITNEDTQSTSGLVITRNPIDGAEVTHFKITSITNGTLAKSDLTAINNGDFITAAEGSAGLRFTPSANLFSPGTTFSFQVQGATSNTGNGLSSGFATATITVNPVADTPSVTNASTIVNTQSTSGLVISRNSADGTEVTNFKITNITGGTLFKNNGTTQIDSVNPFITFAEGNAGLKFTPALDSNANGSFQVQASLSNANGGLGGGLATATITVNCGPTLVLNSNDSGSGSLRATINTACAGSTITFNPVLTGQTITLTSGELLISKSLTIQGPAGNLTVMRSAAGGTPNFRIFEINSGTTVTISNLTIANGKLNSTVNLGGGISNSGTLTLTNITLSGNSVSGGSSGNVGGGIYNDHGTLNLTNSTLSGNSATLGSVSNLGGGIYNDHGTLNLTNSTLSGNSASGGGGIFSDAGTLTITNSTLSGNSASGGAGGGIYNNGGTLTLTNSTFSNNSSGSLGGGIFNLGTAQLRNSIIALNTSTTGPDLNGPVTSNGHNLIGNNAGATITTAPGASGDLIGTSAAPINARLSSLANYGGLTQTMALLPGSPAINAGDNCVTQAAHCGDPNISQLTTDQRGTGFNRVVNTTVDIGAFESRGFTITAISGTPQNATILTAFGSPLVANIGGVGGEPIVGGVITFTAPASGASATLTGGTITVNATINGSGQASTSATANGLAGAYNVTASGASSTSASFSLTNNRAASSTAVTSSVNPSDLNQSVTFTATVTGPVAKSGTVQFKDNGVNLGGPAAVSSSGVAQLSTTALSTGTHAITADYSGDANLLPSTGTLAGGQTVIFRPLIKFSQPNYDVNENGKFVTVTVNRSGDQSTAFSVDYTTPDDSAAMSVLPCSNANGVASPRCDFTTALGTLRFAAGESSKTFDVLISQDTFVEGNEKIALTLSNPTGGGGFAQPSDANATVTIIDDDLNASSLNPIDDTDTFVRQTYHDFLNREPDAPGLAFWKDTIDKCNDPARRPAGQTVAQCLEVQRINTSAAFFLSIEFQNTGYFVERAYKSGFGDINPPTVPVPIRFTNFLRDTQAIGAGVVVGVGNWQAQLDANKRAYALAFVQRPEFLSRYPAVTSAAAFVDALNANAGMVLTDSQRSALIAELAPNSSDPALRADVLMKVAENAVLQQREFNRAFVLMQYFGYLRRNPDAAPEATLNFAGFNFWLNKLNQFNGDYIGAEMIKAFIGSDEYRKRFGP